MVPEKELPAGDDLQEEERSETSGSGPRRVIVENKHKCFGDVSVYDPSNNVCQNCEALTKCRKSVTQRLENGKEAKASEGNVTRDCVGDVHRRFPTKDKDGVAVERRECWQCKQQNLCMSAILKTKNRHQRQAVLERDQSVLERAQALYPKRGFERPEDLTGPGDKECIPLREHELAELFTEVQ